MLIPRAHFGSMPSARAEISVDEPWWNWMREHGTLHVPDIARAGQFHKGGLPKQHESSVFGRPP